MPRHFLSLSPLVALGGLLPACAVAEQPVVDLGWRYTVYLPPDEWQSADFDDRQWAPGTGGFGTTSTPGARVGTEWKTADIWLRKRIEWPTVPARLSLLIHHDEDAEVYVNGRQVAVLDGYTTKYELVPLDDKARAAVRKGKNLLAVHCHHTSGGQFVDVHLVDADNVPRLPPPKRKTMPLTTRWGREVTPDNAWRDYPRPQLVRDDWTNLNGHWDYAITARDADRPSTWDGQILVPFCLESSLSGVAGRVGPDQRLWYRRAFQASRPTDGGRLLLHFGAVDWQAEVQLNGQFVGSHRGGYDPFTLDITAAVVDGQNQLEVAVWDPTDSRDQPRGKQVLAPRGIWYTPVTGIWQTVWLEPTPATYVRSLKIVPDVVHSGLTVDVHASNEADVRVEVRDGEEIVADRTGRTGRALFLPIQNPKLWSPDSPHLYDLRIELQQAGRITDTVQSYAGIRNIAVGKDAAGVNRLLLNGEPLFQFGPLDQGWWPDGLYTAASDEALKYDVAITKAYGFNMTRKHVKVEPDRWYYWCDRLGLLVWQDMPNGHTENPKWVRDPHQEGPEYARSSESAQQFHHELRQLVQDFGNHPSIVVWVPFNERWGQFDTEATVSLLRRLDPARPINSASGGNFQGVGDILDVHSYPDPTFPGTDPYQAVVCGEFGGLGLPIEGHTLLAKGNWGYKSFQSKQALTDAYLERLAKLEPMIAQGLAAAIYTQLSDVEVEVNGLMTYDRQILKLDPQVIGKANRKLYQRGRVAAE